jgi:hypothetical protein
MTTATWILIAMLTPFCWGMGLLLMALIGDLFPSFRTRVVNTESVSSANHWAA